MIKKILIGLFAVVLIYFFFNPILIQIDKSSDLKSLDFSKGEVFKIRKLLSAMDSGNYKVYIILDHKEVQDISLEVKKHKVLKTTDQKIINKLLDLKFIYRDADMATIQSKIFIFSENRLIFSSSLSLDSVSPGLQNRTFGWITPKETQKLTKICAQFNKYYMPILIF